MANTDSSAPRNYDNIFFPAITFAMTIAAYAGFTFTYFGPILSREYQPAGYPLHIHGWSFFLWYLLLPIQAILIARAKPSIHRVLGLLSIALVTLMTATGVIVLTVRVEEAMRNGGPEIWLLYGPLIFSNLVLFVSFYSAGIVMAVKYRIDAHKRLLVTASAIGLGAALFRLILFTTGHPLSVPAGIFAGGLFILAGIAYDRITRGKVHPVFWIGLVALLVVSIPLLPQINGWFGEWVNRGLAVIGEWTSMIYVPEPTVEFRR